MKLFPGILPFLVFFLLFSANASANPCEVDEGSGTRGALWDRWYTVSTEGDTPYAFYNEVAEVKGNRVEVRTRTWKKVQGNRAEEKTVAIAQYDKFLSPVEFTSESKGAGPARNYRGRASGDTLSISGSSSRQVKMPAHTILTGNFPLWLKARMGFIKQLKANQNLRFTAVAEGDAEGGFKALPGIVKPAGADAFSKSTGTERLYVAFGNIKALWWVKNDGSACQIQLPGLKTTVRLVSRSTAQGFLE